MQRRRIHQNTNVSVNRVENCPVNFRPELSTVLATLLCGWSYHEIDFTVLRIFLFSLTFVYIVLQTVFFSKKIRSLDYIHYGVTIVLVKHKYRRPTNGGWHGN